MAVHLATSSDYLTRTTSLIASTGPRTVMCWTRQNTIPTGGGYNTAFATINNTPALYWTSMWALFQTDFPVDELDGECRGDWPLASHASASAGDYVHHCWAQAGTSQLYYRNGVLIGTVTQTITTLTSVAEVCGGDSFGFGDYDVAYMLAVGRLCSRTTRCWLRWSHPLPSAPQTSGWTAR